MQNICMYISAFNNFYINMEDEIFFLAKCYFSRRWFDNDITVTIIKEYTIKKMN